jgi:hypothetical protein
VKGDKVMNVARTSVSTAEHHNPLRSVAYWQRNASPLVKGDKVRIVALQFDCSYSNDMSTSAFVALFLVPSNQSLNIRHQDTRARKIAPLVLRGTRKWIERVVEAPPVVSLGGKSVCSLGFVPTLENCPDVRDGRFQTRRSCDESSFCRSREGGHGAVRLRRMLGIRTRR